MSGPVRPVGVYIVLPDGDTIPVELTYTGFVDGSHVWDSMTPIPPGARMHVAMFPAHTSIRLPGPHEDSDE